MKLKMLKRTLQGQRVIPAGEVLETREQHGRELIRRGYAELVGAPAGKRGGKGARGEKTDD